MRANAFFSTARWVVAGAMAAAAPLFGYVLSKDASEVYVNKWPTSPVTMQVKLATTALSDGFSQSTSVIEAMKAWNVQLGTLQFAWQTSAPGTYKNGNQINEVVMDATVDGDEFGDGTLAVTVIYTSGNDVVETDVVFNRDDYTWDSYRGNRRSSPDIRRVAIHELGHALGLDHPDQAGQTVSAVMNSKVSDVDGLRPDDISGGQKLYGVAGAVVVNDLFANASIIGLNSGTVVLTGTTIGASRQAGEPRHQNVATGHSIWWKWTATKSGSVTATTLGSDFDTVLAVYTGSASNPPLNSLAPLTSNDDEESPAQNSTPQRKRTSSVSFNATAGTTYYFAVDGWGDDQEAGYTGSVTLNVTFSPVTDPNAPVSTTRLMAISARCGAGNGDQTLIMGYVVSGGGTKQVLLRGVGPTLTELGVTTALSDPVLQLFQLQGGAFSLVDENDNWGGSNALKQTFARLGNQPLKDDSKDAALLKLISGGVYTAHVTAKTTGTGIALVEAYDADDNGATRFTALSTRTVAGSGDNVLIAGVVLAGTGQKSVLIRALGPSLVKSGVPASSILTDPQLQVFQLANGNWVQIGQNNDWNGTAELKAAFASTGAGTLDSDASKDAAILLTLDPGVYTVHVSGAGSTTGVALAEIFEVE